MFNKVPSMKDLLSIHVYSELTKRLAAGVRGALYAEHVVFEMGEGDLCLWLLLYLDHMISLSPLNKVSPSSLPLRSRSERCPSAKSIHIQNTPLAV